MIIFFDNLQLGNVIQVVPAELSKDVTITAADVNSSKDLQKPDSHATKEINKVYLQI